MDKTFTASEVRELAEWLSGVSVMGTGKTCHMLHAYADRLEAREKAVPVAYAEFADNGCVRMWSREWFADAHGAPVNPTPLYAHPAPADAERLAEALRQAAQSLRTIERGAMREEGLEDAENVRAYARSRADVAGNALTAHSTQAQPPASSVTDAMAVFEVVSGVEGPCLTISRKDDGKPRHEYRLAGPKPWGGGNTTHSFKVHTRELREQIDAIEAALAAQENPNG